MQRLLCRGTSNHDAWIIDKNNRFDSFRRTIPLLYICYRLFNTEILYFENKNSKDFIDLNIHCSQRMHSTNKIRTIFTFIQWVTLKEKEISKLFTSLLNYLFIPCAPRDNAKSQFTNCGGETSTRDKQFPRNCRPERERESKRRFNRCGRRGGSKQFNKYPRKFRSGKMQDCDLSGNKLPLLPQ